MSDQKAGFQKTLVDLNQGAALSELSDALDKVVAAVRQTGKGGSLALTLKVRPASKGVTNVVLVESEMKMKLPEPERGMTIFFVTEDNKLVRNDPRQQTLPLRVVEFDQQNLREVSDAV